MAQTLLFQLNALSFENGSDIKFMQLFIDIVDAKLFVVVHCEVLKTENIKETDCLGSVLETIVVHVSGLNRSIHHDDKPIE